MQLRPPNLFQGLDARCERHTLLCDHFYLSRKESRSHLQHIHGPPSTAYTRQGHRSEPLSSLWASLDQGSHHGELMTAGVFIGHFGPYCQNDYTSTNMVQLAQTLSFLSPGLRACLSLSLRGTGKGLRPCRSLSLSLFTSLRFTGDESARHGPAPRRPLPRLGGGRGFGVFEGRRLFSLVWCDRWCVPAKDPTLPVL